MQAQLDKVNGTPVLRLETRLESYNGGKRAVFDLPLTPEQAKLIDIQMQGRTQ
jgi:hypothetical protein